jgi:hypothetical protein
MSTSTRDGEHAEPPLGWAEIQEDIRIAEDQITRGQGVEHDAAREQVLTRLFGQR